MADRIKPGTQFGVAPKKVSDFVAEIEDAEAKIESKQGEYMNYAARKREEIAAVLDAAKEAGLDKKAIKLKVKERRILRRLEADKRAMEPEQMEMFGYIGQCLGETDEPETPAETMRRSAAASDKALKEAIGTH